MCLAMLKPFFFGSVWSVVSSSCNPHYCVNQRKWDFVSYFLATCFSNTIDGSSGCSLHSWCALYANIALLFANKMTLPFFHVHLFS